MTETLDIADDGTAEDLPEAHRRAEPPFRSRFSAGRVVFALLVTLPLMAVLVLRGLPHVMAARWPNAALWLNKNDTTALLAVAEAYVERNRIELTWRRTDASLRWRPLTDVEQRRKDTTAKELRRSEILAGVAKDDRKSSAAATRTGVEDDKDDDESVALRERAKSFATRVVSLEPLNARAPRILGLIALEEGRVDDARALFLRAVSLSAREAEAVNWLMLDHIERGNAVAAVPYADLLIRNAEGNVRAAALGIARITERDDKAGIAAINALLATEPPWREVFFAELVKVVTDARSPLVLLMALKTTAYPPTHNEVRPYINFLVDKGFAELAYFTWLNFLPPSELQRIGTVQNAGFEREPSGYAFDWVIPRQPGVVIGLAARPDKPGEQALYLEFTALGAVNFKPVQQVLMLGAGTYTIKGTFRSALSGRRGLRWRLACSGEASVMVGQSNLLVGETQDWSEFTFQASIPETDCRTQTISLVFDARSRSEALVSGNAWFDDLSIVRVEPTVAPAPTAGTSANTTAVPVATGPGAVPNTARAADTTPATPPAPRDQAAPKKRN